MEIMRSQPTSVLLDITGFPPPPRSTPSSQINHHRRASTITYLLNGHGLMPHDQTAHNDVLQQHQLEGVQQGVGVQHCNRTEMTTATVLGCSPPTALCHVDKPSTAPTTGHLGTADSTSQPIYNVKACEATHPIAHQTANVWHYGCKDRGQIIENCSSMNHQSIYKQNKCCNTLISVCAF